MTELFTVGAKGRLNAGITAGATSLTLRAGQGALFPSFGASDFAWLTLEQDAAGNPTRREIVRATARSGDVLTVARAQQGTVGQTFDAGARVELRLTAATMAAFQDALGFSRKFVTGIAVPTGNGASPAISGPLGVATTTTEPLVALGTVLSTISARLSVAGGVGRPIPW